MKVILNRKANLALLKIKSRAFRLCGISESQFMLLTPSEFKSIQDDTLDGLEAGDSRENRRVGRICAAIYNNNANRKKSSKKYTEEDFIPQKVEKAKGNSAENLLAKVSTINSIFQANQNANPKTKVTRETK